MKISKISEPGFVITEFSPMNQTDRQYCVTSTYDISKIANIIAPLTSLWPKLINQNNWKEAWEINGICMPFNGEYSQLAYFDQAIQKRRETKYWETIQSKYQMNQSNSTISYQDLITTLTIDSIVPVVDCYNFNSTSMPLNIYNCVNQKYQVSFI